MVNLIIPGHLLYDLFNGLKQLINNINSFAVDPSNYDQRLVNFGYEITPLDLNDLQTKLCDFIMMLSNGFDKLEQLIKLCQNNTTDNIKKEITTPKSIQMVQWGGFQRLYSIYKNYYMEQKGGALFNPANKIIKTRAGYGPYGTYLYTINGLKYSHQFTDGQISYIELLFLNVLKDVSWNGIKFTLADIQSIKPLSCGTFGCGFMLSHSGTGKKFIFKVCGSGPVPIDNNEYLKEVFNGYYTIGRSLNMFNKSYGYFATSRVPTDLYFKSNTPELIYSGLINNSNPTVRSGNIFAIFMSAGDGDLTALTYSLSTIGFSNGLASNDPANIKSIMKTLYTINSQMFEIGDISQCSKISKQCTYLTHNDIKPPNMIYNLVGTRSTTLNSDYKIEYIDYGGFIFSNSFFTNIKTHTPVMLKLVYGGIYNKVRTPPTSPLFDIASAIYTIIILLTPTGQDYGYYDTEIKALRQFYLINDLPQIKIELDKLFNKIHVNINNNIFRGSVVNTNTNPYMLTYFYVLSQYINLAMCIYRFHLINIIPSLNYSNLEFKDFEILDITIGNNPVGFVKVGQGLNDRQLLRAIMDYVKGKVSMIGF